METSQMQCEVSLQLGCKKGEIHFVSIHPISSMDALPWFSFQIKVLLSFPSLLCHQWLVICIGIDLYSQFVWICMEVNQLFMQ